MTPSVLHEIIRPPRTRATHFMNAALQVPSFFHLRHPGKKRLLKHSSHSASLRFGSVASKRSHSALARDMISTQFCRGTVCRTLRCRRHVSYAPSWSLHKLRRIGLRHGLSDESDAMACSRRERYDTRISEATSSSPRISAMSSTGRDSNSEVVMCESVVEVWTQHREPLRVASTGIQLSSAVRPRAASCRALTCHHPHAYRYASRHSHRPNIGQAISP